jgi:hypothetical protein
LPFVQVTVYANGKAVTLQRVLLDTGSAGTIFKTDDMETIGLKLGNEDRIRYMVGIGGTESVIEKEVEAIEIGDLRVSRFLVQLGALNYGFEIDGILGADFLLQAKAQINFNTLILSAG